MEVMSSGAHQQWRSISKSANVCAHTEEVICSGCHLQWRSFPNAQECAPTRLPDIGQQKFFTERPTHPGKVNENAGRYPPK